MLPGTTASTPSPSRTRVPSTDASRPTRLIQPSRVSTTLVFSLTMYASSSNSGVSSPEASCVLAAVAVLLAQLGHLVLDRRSTASFPKRSIASIFSACFVFSASSSRIFWISIWAIL